MMFYYFFEENDKMNVFIFSNAFVAKSLAFALNYILNQPISQIYVLEENHNQSDFVSMKIPVIVHEDIDFCIQNCDLTIIVTDNNVPETNIEKVTKKVKEREKHIIIINNPWVKYKYSPFEFCKQDITNIPLVCVFGIGYISQLFCTELLLNDILEEENITHNHFFTPETKDLLRQIDESGFLNNDLKELLEKTDFDKNLTIMSFNSDDSNNSTLLEYAELIKELSPDYIILQTSKDVETKKMKEIFEKSMHINVDMLIKSNFISFESIPVYEPCFSNDEEIYLEELGVRNLIKKKILSKIGLPAGMKVF